LKLEGSCHCGAVKFTCETNTPQPYQRCYCSVCRKTAGGGGYAINLMAWTKTLKVTGKKNAGTYHAIIDGEKSEAERRFCKRCGSPLWLYDPRWPDLIHPVASAIDTPLPVPKASTHVLLDSKASWVEVPEGKRHQHFDHYPELSIEDWHRKNGAWVE
jgi:hypothetical protein